jgi:hypothetical protein
MRFLLNDKTEVTKGKGKNQTGTTKSYYVKNVNILNTIYKRRKMRSG